MLRTNRKRPGNANKQDKKQHKKEVVESRNAATASITRYLFSATVKANAVACPLGIGALTNNKLINWQALLLQSTQDPSLKVTTFITGGSAGLTDESGSSITRLECVSNLSPYTQTVSASDLRSLLPVMMEKIWSCRRTNEFPNKILRINATSQEPLELTPVAGGHTTAQQCQTNIPSLDSSQSSHLSFVHHL